MELVEKIAVSVEEGAVDPSGAGDRGNADVRLGGAGRVDGADDTLASTAGVGPAPVGEMAAGHATRSGRTSGSGWRERGMPRPTMRFLFWRTTATASVICAFLRGEFVQVGSHPGDEATDPLDLVLGGHGLLHRPGVGVHGCRQALAMAQQVGKVALEVGKGVAILRW
ncbi:hypothetical protein [Actinoplanes regularis]|uniref:hypothetical protein n=1 Tax=Actinoplanes regularis TaxID=52697 RepID=UPI0024A06755|nr:hypothetical protein [Actinoplanes regularis]GLW34489.1 hypothetical protein Areg01_74260 [Actinoplanes regularis]